MAVKKNIYLILSCVFSVTILNGGVEAKKTKICETHTTGSLKKGPSCKRITRRSAERMVGKRTNFFGK